MPTKQHGAWQQPDLSGYAPDAASSELDRLRSDEAFQRQLQGHGGASAREAALDHIEALAKLKAGEGVNAPDKQAGIDGDYAPKNQAEYKLETPRGNQWSEESSHELNSIKAELFKQGVHPATANAVFSDFGGYVQSSDADWRARIETAAGRINAKEGGPEIIAAAERYINSGLSETMLEACAIAAASELGIKELARLGRGLARKGAH